MSLDDATAQLLHDLADVHDTIPRCARCECFVVVAAQARLDLKRVDSAVAREACELFARWLDEAEGRVKTCNNCEVCVPSGPYQRFTTELARARDEATGGSSQEGAEDGRGA